MKSKAWLFGLVGILVSIDPAEAQLNQVFDGIFNQLLREDLSFSPSGRHGRHFFDAADAASSGLTPALNSFIANSVTSFPLSSTVAGITFDFRTGQPVSIRESLGPIFGETAETLGKAKVNVGLTYTYLDLSEFRGLPTAAMRLTFAHQDVGGSGTLGDRLDESDVIHLALDLGIQAHSFALFTTAGITDRLDIGVAIPIIHLNLSGNARASIDSHTERQTGSPDHAFPGGELEGSIPYDETALGMGDVAFRVKYNFVQGPVYLATLLDLRLIPGDQDDFMSSGRSSFKISTIMSKQIGGFTPHLNVGYDRRPASLDSDELEFIVGFDQKLTTGITFAADLLGEYDLDKNEAINFAGTIEITDQDQDGQEIGTRTLEISNIPERNFDNILSGSVGLRLAPSERVSLLGNVLIALNDGGLRADVIPTFGLTMTF